MNNIEKALTWVCSMAIIGTVILMVLEDMRTVNVWIEDRSPWSDIMIMISVAAYMLVVMLVAEYLVKKDGKEIYIRSKWQDRRVE